MKSVSVFAKSSNRQLSFSPRRCLAASHPHPVFEPPAMSSPQPSGGNTKQATPSGGARSLAAGSKKRKKPEPFSLQFPLHALRTRVQCPADEEPCCNNCTFCASNGDEEPSAPISFVRPPSNLFVFRASLFAAAITA
jgi:hypothetical protein